MGAFELIVADLRRHGGENFWPRARLERLTQLGVLGALLPRWATSRWILAQACQTVDESDCRAGGVDHDWISRQTYLYELGGLEHFLTQSASADLLTAADRINEWAETPMSGYQLMGETPHTLTWRDLGSDDKLDSINIGAAVLSRPGECAIGRLVPIEGGAMFETEPLHVPEDVARQVADDPRAWLPTLSAAMGRSRDERSKIVSSGDDSRLLTDVPVGIEGLVGLYAADPPDGRLPDLKTVDDLQRLKLGLVRAALDQKLSGRTRGLSTWPSVAATLVDPYTVISLLDSVRPSDRPKLLRLADLLGGPAATVCRTLAEGLTAAA